MSERTTIGGTVYEAIGSSSSNLLLKCNGTARIQWGNKLIDLIKNGKIASESSLELIFIISDESLIKSDGVYLLTTEETSQLWVSKDGNKYNLTGTDLYISASKPLELTVEQKKQALDNIGMYYNTLSDVQSSGVKNGIVYVLDTKTLYTIKDGVIEEFEAKLKTVTVDKETVEGEIINSSVKIVLSILDLEYLILADLRITANYSIHVKNSAQLGSESADKTHGYRLYIEGDTSYLDVDEINVRNGIIALQYIEITFQNITMLINNELLKPGLWYLINDFLNHWKLAVDNTKFNRPILVQAFDKKSLYEKGQLFNNRHVEIKYDVTYQEPIKQILWQNGILVEEEIKTRGRITWMKDTRFNNEANFDFLDYIDVNEKDITTLHYPNEYEEQDRSVFPKFSYNNTLIVYNLYGTVLKNKVINNNRTNIIDFLFDDSSYEVMQMHDNYIECRGLIVTQECRYFINNILTKAIKLQIGSSEFSNNLISEIYYHPNLEIINFDNIEFDKLEDDYIFNTITFESIIKNNTCKAFINSIVYDELINNKFGIIENSVFNQLIKDSVIESIKKYGNGLLYQFLLIKNSKILEISNKVVCENSSIINSKINIITNNSIISNTIENSTIDVIDNSQIIGQIQNSEFREIVLSNIIADINESVFRNLYNCLINTGIINNIHCFADLSETLSEITYPLLYDTSKRKEVYNTYEGIKVVCIPEQIFYRGMIVMHSGIEEIPQGWALCNGLEYEWNGIKSKTPDLRNRFIRATQTLDSSEVKASEPNTDINEKGELFLKALLLPEHHHNHESHTHTLSNITIDSAEVEVKSSTTFAYSDSNKITVNCNIEDADTVDIKQIDNWEYVESSGSHSHIIKNGTLDSALSKEKSWENQNIWEKDNNGNLVQMPIKPIPNYYSLIFIMKL